MTGHFNPRSRVGSDTDASRIPHEPGNFNPRSRVGSDKKLKDADPSKEISIHAPAWGATSVSDYSIIRLLHFNPRSRVGSDRTHAGRRACNHDFNPRSRVGSDVSQFRLLIIGAVFQSTLPRGERHLPLWALHRSIVFQSTLPRGERLTSHSAFASVGNFNPRSRVGSDGLMSITTSSCM